MISRTAINAVLAVARLAKLRPGEYSGASTIAEEIDARPNYLGKLLKALAERGILESQRGFGGGFRLARAADRISLYDVVNSSDRIDQWRNCFLGGKCGDGCYCAVHPGWRELSSSYLGFLKNTTIAEILTTAR